MDILISLSDSQLPIVSSFLKEDQEKLLPEITALKEEIEKLTVLLKNKEDRYNANIRTLSKLRDNNNALFNDMIPKPFSFTNIDFLQLPAGLGQPEKHLIQNDYNINGSSWNKICFILTRESKVLSAREILKHFYQMEPEQINVPDNLKKKNETNIFAILTNYSKEGKIIRFKDNGIYKYAFKQWMNEDGEIKKEYLV
jgi:hypothetical protein